MLTVVDCYTRECLAIGGRKSEPDLRTARPAQDDQDRQCSEFISKVMDKWAYERGVEIDFSRPGKPTDNARVEGFNGKLRQECLNANWFLSRDDVKARSEPGGSTTTGPGALRARLGNTRRIRPPMRPAGGIGDIPGAERY